MTGICLIFPYIGNVIIPTDFHIVQRGRYTTNQLKLGFEGLEYETIDERLVAISMLSGTSG